MTDSHADHRGEHRVIGGMFALHLGPPARGNPPPFPKQSFLRLINASSAIWLLVSVTSPRRVWLPSFLCHSIIDAVRRSESEIRFYAIDEHLRLSDRQWIRFLDSGDLVLFIDYFGFPTDREAVEAASAAGARTVRDASQALLSDSDVPFDYTIYSPRKTLGVPDGGLLFYAHGALESDIELESPPEAWSRNALLASVRRAAFDMGVSENRWYSLFQELESRPPIGAYRMSELSELLLEFCFDMESIRRSRRENYATLAAELAALALFPELPSSVTPMGFPVRVRQRDAVRDHLVSHHIYPPVHWRIDGVVPDHYSESHALSNSIMTLPCDQRYDSRDMQRIVAHLTEAIAP